MEEQKATTNKTLFATTSNTCSTNATMSTNAFSRFGQRKETSTTASIFGGNSGRSIFGSAEAKTDFSVEIDSINNEQVLRMVSKVLNSKKTERIDELKKDTLVEKEMSKSDQTKSSPETQEISVAMNELDILKK